MVKKSAESPPDETPKPEPEVESPLADAQRVGYVGVRVDTADDERYTVAGVVADQR